MRRVGLRPANGEVRAGERNVRPGDGSGLREIRAAKRALPDGRTSASSGRAGCPDAVSHARVVGVGFAGMFGGDLRPICGADFGWGSDVSVGRCRMVRSEIARDGRGVRPERRAGWLGSGRVRFWGRGWRGPVEGQMVWEARWDGGGLVGWCAMNAHPTGCEQSLERTALGGCSIAARCAWATGFGLMQGSFAGARDTRRQG